MISDEHADRLAEIAVELVHRVRDYGPEDNGRWLARKLPGAGDWFALAFVLACAVPDDRTWRSLTQWALPERLRRIPREGLKPCGTIAAARRHRYHSEDLDEACREAERERDRARAALRAGSTLGRTA